MKRLLIAFVFVGVFTTPLRAGGITISTDKSVYYPDEKIEIEICATGPPSSLQFPSSCQADYIMDYSYDSKPGVCLTVISYAWLPETWTKTHNWSKYNPGIGTHYVTGYLYEPWTMSFPSDVATFRVVPHGDINKDGFVNLLDFRLLSEAWLTQPSDDEWNEECDLAIPEKFIDIYDLFVMAIHWLEGELME